MISANPEKKRHATDKLGVFAEYQSPDDLLAAAGEMHRSGYRKLDAHSPFPIHGMDQVLQIRPSVLPWIALVAGVIGGGSALFFQWWTNTIDYPYLVSGKPLFSLPANIPVTFEVTILLAAFATFFGMLTLNGLPRLHNPLLNNERFRRVTSDGFLLFVDARDQRYSEDTISDLRDKTAAIHIESIKAEEPNNTLPRGFVLAGVIVASLALLPPLAIAKARTRTSDKPRLHNFFDMDFQQKFKSQTSSRLFADGRSMRPRVVGTIPRGSLAPDPQLTYGIHTDEATDVPTVETSGETPPATAPPKYVDRIPLPVTAELMRLGRTQFDIHCAVCHGRAGYGNGLASQRALELEQGTWVPPTNLHTGYLLDQPDGQIFQSITNGVRKMPSYGHQIPPRERWAIVAYVRALQRCQNTTIDDVPEDYRQSLREFN